MLYAERDDHSVIQSLYVQTLKDSNELGVWKGIAHKLAWKVYTENDSMDSYYKLYNLLANLVLGRLPDLFGFQNLNQFTR